MADILIVDNEKNILEGLDFLLKDKYVLTLCSSGAEALEAIKKQKFDVALLDVLLGDMDGHEVLREIKKVNPHTKVIMISAYIVDAIKSGAEDYIVKPFDNDDLLDVVKCLLEKGKPGVDISIFTENERKIMPLLYNGKMNKEIAKIMKKSEECIKSSLYIIYTKLEVNNRVEATKKIATLLNLS